MGALGVSRIPLPVITPLWVSSEGLLSALWSSTRRPQFFLQMRLILVSNDPLPQKSHVFRCTKSLTPLKKSKIAIKNFHLCFGYPKWYQFFLLYLSKKRIMKNLIFLKMVHSKVRGQFSTLKHIWKSWGVYMWWWGEGMYPSYFSLTTPMTGLTFKNI
jgi:hypothetical protein